MHVDEKSFATRVIACRPGSWVTPVHNGDLSHVLSVWSLLSRTCKYRVKMSAGHMDYVLGGWWEEEKKIVSHLSCLWHQAVCLTSHINNVMGPNLPGLWRSHGSLLIPFDWEMTFIVGRSEMTSSWQIFERAKRSDNPSPQSFTTPCSPSIPSRILVLFVLFARHLSRKKECGCFK